MTECTDRDMKAACGERGIHVADDNDWHDTSWILWFGAYGWTRVLVWGDLQDALEDSAGLLADKAPGVFCTDSVDEEYTRAACEYTAVHALLSALGCADEYNEERCAEYAHEQAEIDVTYTESGYIASYEWGCVVENPTLADIMEFPVK